MISSKITPLNSEGISSINLLINSVSTPSRLNSLKVALPYESSAAVLLFDGISINNGFD
jgi:hypothetical protein